MLKHSDLKPGIKFILDGEPYEVIDSTFIFKGRGSSTIQAKIRNLINNKVLTKTFHQNDEFEEAEIDKEKIIFLYSKNNKFYFLHGNQKIEIDKSILGNKNLFLKEKDEVIGIFFNEKLIGIELPLKMQFKVISAPPGIKGGRETPGTKPVIIETGATIQVPFIY
ncbi:MAG: elongation factor P [Candidatus Parcubacteria bacterium]|nr:MAG: elongation factor P [Candidatus Parcubacteria bacterium]